MDKDIKKLSNVVQINEGKIQDHLGYLNDSVVACRLLTRQENKMEYWPESMQSYQAYREKD